MHKSIVLGFILISSIAFGKTKMELMGSQLIPHKMKFEKTTVGGLSGIVWDQTESKLYAICDDRGNIDEPRFFQFSFKMPAKVSDKTPFTFEVNLEKVIYLKVNPTELSHTKKRVGTEKFSLVLDMEGISKAPWGDFLVTSEGDANHKPRVMPQFFSVKPDGTIMKDFEVPKDYLPEKSGKQKKGIQNNKAFEGLAANPNGKEWILAIEENLVQDKEGTARLLQYTMPDAFVLKPGKEWKYPLSEDAGISEITYLSETKLLVMERGFVLGPKGAKTLLKFFEFDLTKDNQKTLVFDLLTDQKVVPFENFEGMTIGPKFPDGKRSLIVVSDDNFMRHQETKFLVFKLTE